MRRCVSTLALLALLASACAKKKPAGVHEAATLEAAPSLYATLDGLRVHYKLVGHGHATPIVFVHGWTCDMSSWTKQVPFFAESGRVVALDLPGHGGSDKPEIPYTYGPVRARRLGRDGRGEDPQSRARRAQPGDARP